MRPFRATTKSVPYKLVVCRECQIPIEPVRHHLIPREGRGLIFEIWMCCFYQTSNTINLVTATKYTAFGVMEYCIFVKDLVACSATTHGVVFAKYVAQITKQQGRYAVGHGLSPVGNRPRCLDACIEGKLQQEAVC